VQVWVAGLRRRFASRPLAVALEQQRGALVAMLSKYGERYLYPVHPLTLAKYREAWYPSRSKDDPRDADLLREILCQHRDRLRRLDPDTPEMRLLQFQVENRRKLVNQQTALSNRLTDLLKLYYPQILLWFSDPTTSLVGELLLRWPTLPELQKAKPATLEKFFRQHNCRNQPQIEQRIEQIRQAIPATQDEAVIRSSQGMVRVYVEQIAGLRRAISELEKEIVQLARQQPDWEIFELAARGGRGIGAALDGRAGLAPRAVCLGPGPAVLLRYRSGQRSQRKLSMGAQALGLPQILAADLSRMGGLLDSLLRLGQSLLRATAIET
jgi:transposase